MNKIIAFDYWCDSLQRRRCRTKCVHHRLVVDPCIWEAILTLRSDYYPLDNPEQKLLQPKYHRLLPNLSVGARNNVCRIQLVADEHSNIWYWDGRCCSHISLALLMCLCKMINRRGTPTSKSCGNVTTILKMAFPKR